MFLWLELFLIATGITARLIIPASTAGSGLNLLVVIFIWLAFLVHLLEKFRLPTQTPTLPSTLKLLLFLFVFLIIASFINAPYKFGAFQYLVAWISDIVLFYLVYSLCARDSKYVATLLSVFLSAALVVILYGLYQHLWELRDLAVQIQQNPSLLDMIPGELRDATLARAQAGEPFATFAYQNSFGAFLALVISVFIVLALIRPKRWWIWLIVLPISLFVLIQTGSKGAILALILGIGIAGVIYHFLRVPSNKRGFRGVLLLVGGIVAIILLVFISRAQMSDSLNVRLGYLDATVKIIRDNPLSGVGLNQFGNSYLHYKSAEAGEVQKAHNDYFQIASELGIPALLVFLAIWFIILRSISRPVRALNPQSAIHNPPSSVLPYILGAVFTFLLSEIFQTSLIALDTPVISTIIVFVIWLGVFRLILGYLSTGILTTDIFRIGLFAGLLAFLIHCLADFNFYVQGLSMSAWFMGAIFLSTGESGKVIQQTQTKTSKILMPGLIIVTIWISVLIGALVIRLTQYESFLEQGKMMLRSHVQEERQSSNQYLREAFISNLFSADALLELSWAIHCLGSAEVDTFPMPVCLGTIDMAISLNPLAPMLYNQQGRLYLDHAEQERKKGNKKLADIYEQRAKRAFQMVRELYPTYKANKK